MPFTMFYSRFPREAEAETRSVILPKGHDGLPSGAYHFKEMFCDEPGCDCRRVFFWVDRSLLGERHVVSDEPEAVVAWGWEDISFYKAWMKYGSKKDAKDLQGPILNPGSPETKLANGILELFKRVLLKDQDYLDRVRRHYRMFRDAVEVDSERENKIHEQGLPSGRADREEEGRATLNKSEDEMIGECFICHTPITKAKAAQHVKACLKAKPNGTGKPVKAMHLLIEGRYNPEYWMHIEIASATTLYDLDAFLRETWLECCQRMSCFTIDGERYASEPYNESLMGQREKSMDAKLYKVVSPGAKFTHEYDYGSTTDLALRAFESHEAALADTGIRILARNTPPHVLCGKCKKPATIVEAGYGNLNPDRCFCKQCAVTKIEEGMGLPIVNSPRVGVCGYCG